MPIIKLYKTFVFSPKHISSMTGSQSAITAVKLNYVYLSVNVIQDLLFLLWKLVCQLIRSLSGHTMVNALQEN